MSLKDAYSQLIHCKTLLWIYTKGTVKELTVSRRTLGHYEQNHLSQATKSQGDQMELSA